MDLNPLVQFVTGVAVLIITPAAIMLGRRAVLLAEKKFHFTLSEQEEAEIDAAISTGTGLLRAKLAAGTMNLSDVHLGNAHVDTAASAALNIIYAGASQTKISRDEVASRIVGELGHALGDDPSVASVAADSTQPNDVAATDKPIPVKVVATPAPGQTPV